MKVFYFIMSHKNPEQIYRLIRTIKKFSPNSHILLSHNSSKCSLDTSRLEKLTGVYLQFATVERGDFSLIHNYFSAINWIIKNNIDFDWFINLSAQDYPIQPLSEIDFFLSKTKFDGFLNFFKVFSSESNWSFREGTERYLYQYKKCYSSLPKIIKIILKSSKRMNDLQNIFRINSSFGLRIGTKTKSIFNNNFICYGGCFFCILSKKCIQYLNDFYQNNSHVVEYYKYVLVPDESLIQTILINSKKFHLSNECKHYFDFSNSSHGHPAILTEKHYDLMMQSNYFFARKFDINVDSKILDILDQKFVAKSKLILT